MACVSSLYFASSRMPTPWFPMARSRPNGFPVFNPYFAVANQAAKKVRSLLAEFGMSPSSRSRISAAMTGQPADGGEWADLLDD